MKVHYINILLFAIPLNILATLCHVSSPNKEQSITLHHTPKIPTTRSLCECELYAPANYDNDPQMKSVLENFNKQTQQRFEEYDDRMVEKRKQCKDRCNKEIQKIILKDKLEKQMEQQLTTLETKIDTNDIPTCICEKTMEDKTEKFCLNCGKNVGAIAPWWGLVCGAGYAGWLNAAMTAAIEAAEKEGIIAGKKAGVECVVDGLLKKFSLSTINNMPLENVVNINNYNNIEMLARPFQIEFQKSCLITDDADNAICMFKLMKTSPTEAISENVRVVVEGAKTVVESTTKEVTKAAIDTSTEAIEATSTQMYTTITYSILAMLIIVLIMVIIYLILRYRRKKKMKKKLQYIKILEE
ncbi:rifin PIR protein, putative [Plasmodium reichenowi]|uniref:Rifin PIR protein, putative n=1 Tax=Plasmodium reichenowi TaxID=5854 RepID=A0A2P9D401_PLARE|nr:rifin PIR protein, putative [Plasmodium reichenowi]